VLAEPGEFENFRLRREDYSLSEEQAGLRESAARLLAAHAPATRVREVESAPPWFDAALWRRLRDLGVARLGLPGPDGDGGGLVELALVAEEVGRTGSATALAETAATGRMLARLGTAPARRLLGQLLDGSRLVSLVPTPVRGRGPELVPCGTVANWVVALAGARLVATGSAARGAAAPNLASAPLAWWQPDTPASATLADGPDAAGLFAQMRDEWRLLLAAASVGIAQSAVDAAVGYARQRHAFGLPIGGYQAVSHPLVDTYMAVIAARRLVHKAAWFEQFEPATTPELTLSAISFATQTAVSATSVAVHTMGGLGVTVEMDAQLWFRRAKGWAVLAGDADHELAGLFAAGRPAHHPALRDQQAGALA
jgi:alkylation response protein AidB-like acyl-CoA dehydrogenase